jgi:hypothetical protein
MAILFKEVIRITPVGFDIAEELFNRGTSKMRTVIKNTLADTIRFTEKEIPRLIIEKYAITLSSLNDKSRRAKYSMAVTLPTQENLEQGKIVIHSTRFPVMRFTVNPQSVPNQKGIPVSQRVVVTVVTAKGRPQIGKSNRFLARMKSGHLGVYMRKPDATHRRRPDGQNTQLNISEEYMVSIAEMVRGQRIRPILDRKIREKVEQRFNFHTRGNWTAERL